MKILTTVTQVDVVSYEPHGTTSIGSFVDANIATNLRNGNNVLKVEVEIDPEEWGQMVRQYIGKSKSKAV